MISRVLPTLRSAAAKAVQHVRRHALLAVFLHHLRKQAARRDNLLPQRPEALADDADGDDRTQDDGPNGPSGGFNYG